MKKSLLWFFAILAITPLVLAALLSFCVEIRYHPSGNMEPALTVGDRFVVEKLSKLTGAPVERGDIVVYFPPPLATEGKDLMKEPGEPSLPFMANNPVFVGRIIGLPADRVEIKRDQGVIINGVPLDESAYIYDFQYPTGPDGQQETVKASPDYNMKYLTDIGTMSYPKGTQATTIQPYADPKHAKEAVVVPPGHVFILGDHRNSSHDSHIWGFLDQSRIVGHVWKKFGSDSKELERPKYKL